MDRFLEPLKLKERADEDVYFARRDRELIQKLHQGDEETERRYVAELARMRCPQCGARLARVTRHGVTIEECPLGHGMWMTEAEMHALAERERTGWIARYFYRPKPVV
jgi:uncharacterized protein with PIN domain